jgi:hypothetical protein
MAYLAYISGSIDLRLILYKRRIWAARKFPSLADDGDRADGIPVMTNIGSFHVRACAE